VVLQIAPVGRSMLTRLCPAAPTTALRFVIEEVTGGFVDVQIEIEVARRRAALELGTDEASLGGTAALASAPPMIRPCCEDAAQCG